MQFISDLGPLVGIGKRCFGLNDRFPASSEFEIERNEKSLVLHNVTVRVNRFDRAFDNTQGAVDAIIGINREEVWPFTKRIGRAYANALRVFALNAALRYDVGHATLPCCAPAQV